LKPLDLILWIIFFCSVTISDLCQLTKNNKQFLQIIKLKFANIEENVIYLETFKDHSLKKVRKCLRENSKQFKHN